MTVEDLITYLEKLDGDLHVVLSKDSEGNGYHMLNAGNISLASVEDLTQYYLEIGPFDAADAAKDGWDPEDIFINKAVVFYP